MFESLAMKTIWFHFDFLILLMCLIKHPRFSPGGRSFTPNYEELVIGFAGFVHVWSYYGSWIDLGHLSLTRKLFQKRSSPLTHMSHNGTPVA